MPAVLRSFFSGSAGQQNFFSAKKDGCEERNYRGAISGGHKAGIPRLPIWSRPAQKAAFLYLLSLQGAGRTWLFHTYFCMCSARLQYHKFVIMPLKEHPNAIQKRKETVPSVLCDAVWKWKCNLAALCVRNVALANEIMIIHILMA